jgi:hypothetical protein
MWHLDIPCNDELRHLTELAGPIASVYLPTTPVSPQARQDATVLRNLAEQVDEPAITGLLLDLVDDEQFWDTQAHGLGVIATAERMWIYRLPYQVDEVVQVGEQAKILPLIGAASKIRSCHVLVLSEGGARLLDVSADLPPQEVRVPGMPSDAASWAGKASIGDRSHSGRLVGSEGKKVHLRSYARGVDDALRPLLHGDDQPLVLVAPAPIDEIFRSVCSYPHLLAAGVTGNAETWNEAQIAEAVLPVLQTAVANRAADLAELVDRRRGQKRVSTDLSDIARAATAGAVDTLIVDRMSNERGSLDEAGNLLLEDGGVNVVDLVAARVLAAGGRVLALDTSELPGGEATTAILRWA